MTQNQEKTTPREPQLCFKCSEMYGHPTYDQMCSSCFRKQKAQQPVQNIRKAEESSPQSHTSQQAQKSQLPQSQSELPLPSPQCQSEVLSPSKKRLRPTEEGREVGQVKQTKEVELVRQSKEMGSIKQTKEGQSGNGRCSKCNKRTSMLGYSCKHCSGDFCRWHRLPESHECGVDFISLGRKQIKTDNPLVVKTKIEHI